MEKLTIDLSWHIIIGFPILHWSDLVIRVTVSIHTAVYHAFHIGVQGKPKIGLDSVFNKRSK